MIGKRFTMSYGKYQDHLEGKEYDEKWESWKICMLLNELHEENELLKKEYREMEIKIGKLKGEIGELFCENEQLKSQLYCEEEGVCNICKHHYLVKDDESEFGYYNSRCKKGHYECASVSLKYCEDFEKEMEEWV